jgi:hypothetical protein
VPGALIEVAAFAAEIPDLPIDAFGRFRAAPYLP